MSIDDNTNPFPGLRPFHESEQHLFFGRESQVDSMVDRLASNRFLAVVGTSGSGKSSLVNCGLRPALRTGLMTSAGTAWRMAQCRPGGDPLQSLSRALSADGALFINYVDQGMPLQDIVATTLNMSKLGLVDIVEQAHLPEGTNLLLVIDQFEELFRYQHLNSINEKDHSAASQSATAFVNLLLTAVDQSALPIYIVITMRSDFLGDCAQYPGLAEAINKGQYLVPRMTRDQRRSAIAGPIGVGGGKIHPALLTRLVNDVGSDPDQLSILQHALNRTWALWENERNREGMLDLDCYNAIGSMTGALDQHADKAYSELPSDRSKQICETLFKALTDKASDVRGVRRPTRLSTLCELCDATQDEVVSVIDTFRKPSRSFLMPPAGVELQPDTVIDISHESLMRVWKKLNSWGDQEADAARMYKRLAETSNLYREKNAELLRGTDLRVAQQWRKHAKPNLTWAKRYHPDYAQAISFLRKSEKSDQQRKRLYGTLATTALCLPVAYVIYNLVETAKEAETAQALAESNEQKAQRDLIEAENANTQQQARLELTTHLSEINTDALNQVNEIKTQSNFEHLKLVAAEASQTTQLAANELEFYDAIGNLDQEQRQYIVERWIQMRADRQVTELRHAEFLAECKALNVKKDALYERLSVLGEMESPYNNRPPADCESPGEDIDIKPSSPPGTDQVVIYDEEWNATLASLNDDAQDIILGLCEPIMYDIQQNNSKIAKLSTANHSLRSEIEQITEWVKSSEYESASSNDYASPLPSTGHPTTKADSSYTALAANAVVTQSIETSLSDQSQSDLTSIADDDNSTQTQPAVATRQPNKSATRIEDTNHDGFVVCRDVTKLEPIDCGTTLPAGRVYAFARVVSAAAEETLTLQWHQNGEEIPYGHKTLDVKHNPRGYRTFSWITLNAGSYGVTLSDQEGNELKTIMFEVE